MKVVHFIYSFNPGGVESFLAQLVENTPHEQVEMVFISFCDGTLRERVEKAGAKTYVVGNWKKFGTWHRVKDILKQEKADVANCHMAMCAGAVAILCKQLHLPFILYSHNVWAVAKHELSWLMRVVRCMSVSVARRLQTMGIGVSRMACQSMWGRNYEKRHVRYVNLGLDFSRYAPSNVSGTDWRAHYNIPSENIVVTNVAGYRPPKNYGTFIDIACEVIKLRPKTSFLLIGEGSERSMMEEKIAAYGLQKNFVLTGFVGNVPTLLTQCSDMFLFPSLYEGLGLGLVEAQAAGLPCFYSDVVPQEAVINKELVHPLSLNEYPKVWAQEIVKEMDKVKSSPYDKQKAFDAAMGSDFNISNVVNQYIQIWKELKK